LFLGDINSHEELKGKLLSPRTDYIVTGQHECFIFISAQDVGDSNRRRLACIKTSDGGLSFDFVSWITPQTNQYNAIMPCTIRLDGNRFLLAFRRINVGESAFE
jgi:hypothetical protein